MPDPKAKLVGVTSLLLVLITFFVSVRAFVRIRIFRKICWDDALVFLSYSLTVTLCSCVLAMTSFGFGTPIANVPAEDFRQFRKFQFITQLSYVWGFVTVKMSFAVLYFRLLPSQISRRMNQALLVVLGIEGFIATMVVILQCIPLDKAWNPHKEGRCLDLRPFYYVSFGIKLVTDICLFVQPIPAVWQLPLSKEKRIGAIMMLSLGLFVCIIAIIRVSVINRLGADITVTLVEPMLWSQVEVCALIICATIPSFRPFVRYFPTVSKAMGLSTHRSESEPSSRQSHSRLATLLPRRTRIRASEVHAQALGSLPMTVDYDSTMCSRGSAPGLAPLDSDGQDPPGTIVARDVDVVLERRGGDWIVTELATETTDGNRMDVGAANDPTSTHSDGKQSCHDTGACST